MRAAQKQPSLLKIGVSLILMALFSLFVLVPGPGARAAACTGGWTSVSWRSGAPNISGGTFTGGADARTEVQFDWSVPNGSSAGETFEITLPSELVATTTQPISLMSPDGQVVATSTWNAGAKSVVFTLTDYASTHSNVTGTVWFTVGWDRSNVSGTTDLDFPAMNFGGCGSGSLPGHYVADGPSGFEQANGKTGGWLDSAQGANTRENQIGWTIFVATAAEDSKDTTVTIVDTRGPASRSTARR